jgi:hypothetical protein
VIVMHRFVVRGLLGLVAVSLIVGLLGAPAHAFTAVAGAYFSKGPVRILDTRDGTGAPKARLGPGQTIVVQVAGKGYIDTTIDAATFNLTAVNPSADTHLTVYPSDQPLPATSNLNVRAGETRANLVYTKVGPTGAVKITNQAGTVDVLADSAGESKTGYLGLSSLYVPVPPTRLVDTRTGLGAPLAKLGPGGKIDVDPRGKAGYPNDSVSRSVALNVTVVNATQDTHLTVFAFGQTPPNTSTLNTTAGKVTPNAVFINTEDGRFTVRNNSGTADVLVDITGYWDTGGYGQLQPIAPVRAYDSRLPGSSTLSPATTAAVNLQSVVGAVPAVVVNLTGIAHDADTHLTLYGDAGPVPSTSTLNLAAGQTSAVLALVPLSQLGELRIWNNAGHTDVIIDVVGYVYSTF